MNPAQIAATRRALFAAMTALRAIERCHDREREAAAAAAAAAQIQTDAIPAWSSRVVAERKHAEGVKARARAVEAIRRYRALKQEAEHA